MHINLLSVDIYVATKYHLFGCLYSLNSRLLFTSNGFPFGNGRFRKLKYGIGNGYRFYGHSMVRSKFIETIRYGIKYAQSTSTNSVSLHVILWCFCVVSSILNHLETFNKFYVTLYIYFKIYYRRTKKNHVK